MSDPAKAALVIEELLPRTYGQGPAHIHAQITEYVKYCTRCLGNVTYSPRYIQDCAYYLGTLRDDLKAWIND